MKDTRILVQGEGRVSMYMKRGIVLSKVEIGDFDGFVVWMLPIVGYKDEILELEITMH